jgi:hypothetical protein
MARSPRTNLILSLLSLAAVLVAYVWFLWPRIPGLHGRRAILVSAALMAVPLGFFVWREYRKLTGHPSWVDKWFPPFEGFRKPR